MITRIALRLFLFCLILCASMMLVSIWLGEGAVGPMYFQTTASLFIVGLASFLIWFSRVLQAMHSLLRDSWTARLA